jgi:hypothetical protein
MISYWKREGMRIMMIAMMRTWFAADQAKIEACLLQR